MGRAFEYRKAKKFARWDAMSKAFTRLGREIAMAVKQSGPDPALNARLRSAIQNAKSVNMPKDRIDGAIKRASSKEEKDFAEVLYEGVAPHGIGVMIETATDNTTRTVANLRMYFNKCGGSLGTSGSQNFNFDRKAIFRISAEGQDIEDLELELIDAGLEEINMDDDGGIFISTPFSEFGTMQKALEDKGIEILSSSLERIPVTTVSLSEDQSAEVESLIEKLEEDDDVQAVFHNME